jgi:hypothetical protein
LILPAAGTPPEPDPELEHVLRSRPWEVNPVASLVREASRLQWRSDPRRPDADLSFHDELMAITALIDAHPEEFAELLDGLSATVSLASRRTARRRHGNA